MPSWVVEAKCLPGEIVGYEAERSRVYNVVRGGSKFVVVEGPLGAGKTTLVREAMRRLKAGVRVVGGDEAHILGELGASLRKRPGTLADFLMSWKKNLVIFFDENHYLDGSILEIKNAVADNPRLQAVFALTPEQRERLFTKFPEFAYRVGSVNHIMLRGLSEKERLALFRLHAKLPFKDAAKRFIAGLSYPQQILDAVRGLETIAKEEGLKRVDERVLRKYAKPTQAVAVGLLSPKAQRIFELVKASPGGIAPAEIAKRLRMKPVSVRVIVSRELRRGNFIASRGKKLVLFDRGAA